MANRILIQQLHDLLSKKDGHTALILACKNKMNDVIVKLKN
jgi:hypothetical protein